MADEDLEHPPAEDNLPDWLPDWLNPENPISFPWDKVDALDVAKRIVQGITLAKANKTQKIALAHAFATGALAEAQRIANLLKILEHIDDIVDRPEFKQLIVNEIRKGTHLLPAFWINPPDGEEGDS